MDRTCASQKADLISLVSLTAVNAAGNACFEEAACVVCLCVLCCRLLTQVVLGVTLLLQQPLQAKQAAVMSMISSNHPNRNSSKVQPVALQHLRLLPKQLLLPLAAGQAMSAAGSSKFQSFQWCCMEGSGTEPG
jgi:hypothetical protein